MLFKPNETPDKAGSPVARVARSAGSRMVSLFITLLILGGLGYIGWTVFQQKQATKGGGPGARPDLPVPVLAATPRIQDVPVYLDGVGTVRALNTVTVRSQVTVRALNTVTVRSQVDGKLIAVNFI